MSRWRRFIPVAVPSVLGAYFLATDGLVRGAALVAAAVLLLALIWAGVDVNGRVDRAAVWLATAVSYSLAWMSAVLVVLPVWLFNTVVGRESIGSRKWFRWRRRESSQPGWMDSVASEVSPKRTLSFDQTAGTPGRWRPVSAIGALAVLVMVDLGGGIAVNHLFGLGETSQPGQINIDQTLGLDSDKNPITVQSQPRDPREDGPAMSGYPWSHDYFQELNSVGSMYWPFTLYRPRSFTGRYMNLNGWERASYQPNGDAGSMPTVAVLGGSAAFGEGQRDGYTIASYLARRAEAEGMPIRVRNFGQRGWVIWQEMTLYEQLLASGLKADMSIFYDGANDVTVQAEPISGVPTHYDIAEYASRLAGTSDGSRPAAAPVLRSWWTSRSVVWRAGARLFASDSSGQAASDTRPKVESVRSESGSGARGADVYRRGRALTQELSQRYGITDMYFWQPQKSMNSEYRAASSELDAPTVDISGALDGHDDVYLDFVHTNELGAKLVADAMWPTIEPKLRGWYAEHGDQRRGGGR